MSLPKSARCFLCGFVLTSLLASLALLPSIAKNTSAAIELSSDFNGDGYGDLAIGVPGENIGSIVDAGAINVLYGSSSGLRTSAAADGTGLADQFWHQNRPGVEDTAEPNEFFGWSVATGDFNNDGYDDLAIGVPGEVVGTITGAGAVNVLYGSSSGLRTNAAPDGTGRTDQFWHQNRPGVLNVAEKSDGFGASLAVGDFNNDGRDDLAIGVPSEGIGTATGAGAVNLLYGSSSGLQTSSPANQFWHQGKPGVPDSEEPGDSFGGSVAAGDFNKDGKDDLAIGAPNENGERFDDEFGGDDIREGIGGVVVLYGSNSGLQTSAPAAQYVFTGDDEFENTITENAGTSLAAGDFDNDGYDDLAIGVPGEAFLSEDVQTIWNGGAVAVFYGSSSGLGGFEYWTRASPGVEGGVGVEQFFGLTLASGNFNNDAYDDLAIGATGAEAVNVLYGSSSGLQTSFPADQLWTQDSPGVDNAVENRDFFSSSLKTGDFNNDGKDDLAIGVRGEDIGTVADAGAVNVLYGSSSRLQTTSPVDQFWHQGKPGVEDVEEAGDAFAAGKIPVFQ